MLEILKQITLLYREKKEEEKYRAQLIKMPINYDALEHLASKYKDKVITVKLEGGATITIEPRDINDIKYESFRDKFNKVHQ